MKHPSVTFISFGENVASSRLRAHIPRIELAKIGVKQGCDVVVYGKHLVMFDDLKVFKKKIFDCCDNHFDSPRFGRYYRDHAESADLITVNSEVMAEIVTRETHREAFVIPDPYESEEREPGMGKGVLWFGHESNLRDLAPWRDIPDLTIVTGEEWSRERQLKALKDCAVVIIPTGKSMAKSANRLIEAIRNGRYAVCGEIPAHDEFSPYVYVGKDLKSGLEWVYSNPVEALERVRDCQDAIRDKYSPETVSKLWLEAINRVCQLQPTQN